MNGRYLLDTKIIIALFADDTNVIENLAQATEVFMPNIAIGELCHGARKSGRTTENLARVEALIENSTILDCDTETARCYGEIKHQLS